MGGDVGEPARILGRCPFAVAVEPKINAGDKWTIELLARGTSETISRSHSRIAGSSCGCRFGDEQRAGAGCRPPCCWWHLPRGAAGHVVREPRPGRNGRLLSTFTYSLGKRRPSC
jgi:hypothetical protein